MSGLLGWPNFRATKCPVFFLPCTAVSWFEHISAYWELLEKTSCFSQIPWCCWEVQINIVRREREKERERARERERATCRKFGDAQNLSFQSTFNCFIFRRQHCNATMHDDHDLFQQVLAPNAFLCFTRPLSSIATADTTCIHGWHNRPAMISVSVVTAQLSLTHIGRRCSLILRVFQMQKK